jgi:hypothetical protein
MTRDKLIGTARKWQWCEGLVEGWTFNSIADLERFAKRIAASERNACAPWLAVMFCAGVFAGVFMTAIVRHAV